MRQKLARLAAAADVHDLFAFSGLGMAGYGLALIFPPLAWIVVGAVLFWLGAGR
jgi:hypothetical protein